MSRYCSIATCQQFSRTLKAVTNNLKNQKYEKVVELCLQNKNATAASNFLNKIVKNISQLHINSSNETTSSCNSNETRNKKIKTTKLRKEILKLCTNVQRTFSKKETFLWSAAAVSVTEKVSTQVDSTTSPINLQSSIPTKVEPVLEAIPEPPVVEAIPEPPFIPEGVAELVNQLHANGEATFASLGLGGYTPVGLVQNCFEYLHCTLGIEWWVAIALGTLTVRLLLFPLVVLAQRNAAKMNNYLPQMQILQLKMTEARQTGNQMDAARYSQELMVFMKEKGLNPLKNMIVPLAQMPIFVSFFMGLRQMANVPVDSLRTGGMWWFTDLTLPDQYFLLPIITSATLYLTIELGTDTAKLSSQNMQLMKYVLRGLPILIFPFTVNFPGAILCYWASSNFISLAQVGFLRIPSVRDYFNIEPMRKFSPADIPVKPKGFREGIKDSWENLKITKQLEERKRLDELYFQRAGKGPIVKTYKYDPTKQVSSDKPTTPISAKNR